MSDIREVKLPGVGVRYEFETAEGKKIGVISHRTGLREIYVSSGDDPDEFRRVLGLSQDDARTLAELLGGVLAVLTLATKFATGWIGAARSGVGLRGRTRAGAMLTARGEFSIAIAGLATSAGVVADFEALAISYVFVLAIVGPIFVRFADAIGELLVQREESRAARIS